jgi:hypothetical protein
LLPTPRLFIILSIIRQPSGSSSVVERDLAKVDVAGSTPVSRSRFSALGSSRWVLGAMCLELDRLLPRSWGFSARKVSVVVRGAVPKW